MDLFYWACTWLGGFILGAVAHSYWHRCPTAPPAPRQDVGIVLHGANGWKVDRRPAPAREGE